MQHKIGTRTWNKPPPGWITINIDAACEQGIIGMRCVIRDDREKFIRVREDNHEKSRLRV